MKTERITLLTTPQFKTFLTDSAKRDGVSVAELVRSRFAPEETKEDRMVAELVDDLVDHINQSRKALRAGMDALDVCLNRRRAQRVLAGVPMAKSPRIQLGSKQRS